MGEWNTLPGMLTLAFGLGLLHALDADHVLAVSTLAGRRNAADRHPRAFCLRWALGHGGVLMLLGGLAWIVGINIPEPLAHYAEGAVALLLVAMGLWVLFDLRRRSLRLRFHHHAGLPRHAHWISARTRETGHHDHGATLVGALHGTAGSAPLLALIPVTAQQSVGIGFLYLLLFSAGVLLSMLLFGGLLGFLFTRLARSGERALRMMRGLLAAGSVGIGLHLLHSLAR